MQVSYSKIIVFYRLTPGYVVVELFTAYLLPELGKGPIWEFVTWAAVEGCNRNWWSGLIYLQNYIDPTYNAVSE